VFRVSRFGEAGVFISVPESAVKGVDLLLPLVLLKLLYKFRFVFVTSFSETILE
jgi:hypothetical protein